MNQKQSSVTETTSLNAEALHEISRLQENILQTLRNELKKLKEPEVMGASNVSTPVHEIGEDMTPLPSLTVSAANFLKPVRQFSPMTPQRRIMRKLRPIQTKRPLDNSQTPGIKYNYKLRDYPRPWAELPQRKRTISEESLEVHVTTSHFSDMSNFELSVTESGEVARVEEVPSTHEALQVLPQEDQDRVIPSAPDVDRTESSERWKKSIIFKSKPSKVLKYGINSKTSLMRTCSKPCGQPCQSPNTIINQAFVHQVLVNKSPTKSSPRGIRKVVVFPAPLQESKKLKLKNLAALQSSNKYGLPLQLFESSDETNNNFLQDTSAEIEISSKAVCERLNETRMLCDLVYQKLKKSRSVQVFTQKDETVQTDAIPGSFSILGKPIGEVDQLKDGESMILIFQFLRIDILGREVRSIDLSLLRPSDGIIKQGKKSKVL
ncbi:unnamed protein product [Allacma fusca]|uniref:Uncharacterized protein n=1 Tax=Allacma fusca TaxID=39272 RepID=A0A8J2K9I4_9HEXA|nr:unnamed protein product [Allacma fusca]